jgi:hypothetical protein
MLAFLLLPNSRMLLSLPMRLPNWIARFSRAAARGSPKLASACLRMTLSPMPAVTKSAEAGAAAAGVSSCAAVQWAGLSWLVPA